MRSIFTFHITFCKRMQHPPKLVVSQGASCFCFPLVNGWHFPALGAGSFTDLVQVIKEIPKVMEAENGGKINPRFWTQKSHWKGKTRRFFGEFNNFEILASWFHRVINSISSKCALSPWYPHFCAGGAGDCEECSTSGLDRHNASLEISFLCINYPPSFHSVVATHTFLRVKSDVCFRFSLLENAQEKCVTLGVRQFPQNDMISGWQH